MTTPARPVPTLPPRLPPEAPLDLAEPESLLLALFRLADQGYERASHPLARALLAQPLDVARGLLRLEAAGLADARRARLTPAGLARAAAIAAEPAGPARAA